jgi:hypothetical protein
VERDPQTCFVRNDRFDEGPPVREATGVQLPAQRRNAFLERFSYVPQGFPLRDRIPRDLCRSHCRLSLLSDVGQLGPHRLIG